MHADFSPLSSSSSHTQKLLTNLMPKEEERVMIAECRAANPDIPLGPAEEFLYTLASIPELHARLSLWRFNYVFQQVEEVSEGRREGGEEEEEGEGRRERRKGREKGGKGGRGGEVGGDVSGRRRREREEKGGMWVEGGGGGKGQKRMMVDLL